MSNDTTKIDSRINIILNTILKLEGELEGLRFAKKSLGKADATDKKSKRPSDKTKPLDAAPTPPKMKNEPSVKSLVLEVVLENTVGLPYREIARLAEVKAGRPIILKTVSSQLDSLKKDKKVKLLDGLYMPNEI